MLNAENIENLQYEESLLSKRKAMEIDANLLGITKNKTKYSFGISTMLNQDKIISDIHNLTYNNLGNINAYITNNDFQIVQNGKINYKKNNFCFRPEYSIYYNHKYMYDKVNDNFYYLLKAKFKINHFSFLISTSKKPALFENLIAEPILYDYNTLIKYDFSTKPQKAHNLSIKYTNKSADQLSHLRLSLFGALHQGEYYADININDNFSQFYYYYYPKTQKKIAFTFFFDYFLKKIKTTLTIKSYLSAYDYYNIINNSDFRHNLNFTGKYSFNFATGFKAPFNIGNTTDISYLSTYNNKKFLENHSSLENELLIISSIKKLHIKISDYLYIPDLKNMNNNYQFINLKFFYSITNEKEIYFSLNNLLNVKTFNQIQILDYGSITKSINTLSRNFMISYSFNF